MREFKLYNNDNLKVLRAFPDNCIDSIVTDPPYGLSFMGKKWDYDVPSVELWKECFRVLKPGGHLLSFAGTRTQHRMAVNIEDAGFEIRDMIAWVYGSGFPKSHNISKAIDKLAGAEREVICRMKKIQSYGYKGNNCYGGDFDREGLMEITSPATEEAKQWDGWGTALKPALEPITLARKPIKGSVANNVLEWGTGGLNIDGCRIGDEVNERFPANLINDGSEEVFDLLPENAQRFFYIPKCSKKDRNEGLDDFEEKRKVFNGQSTKPTVNGYEDGSVEDKFSTQPQKNAHPTVKPTDLMRYLVRMVTPPNGVVLDPFMGSGSTGKAAMLENKKFIGIEMDKEYYNISEARINFVLNKEENQ